MYETTRLAIALRMARAACQLTQQELASALGVTKTVIARNEKPDMAMRADTLVRLIYVMREQGVEIDVFSTLDSVRLYTTGEHLDATAMRVARAALNLNQQAFADTLGLTKPIVTRGERPTSIMRSDVMVTMRHELNQRGIQIDWIPIVQDLTVTVHPRAVEAIDALQQGDALPGEPNEELVPTTLAEKLRGETTASHRVEKRKKDTDRG
ncbi:helix-turn-helix domain-containing protein [Halomonas sp. IOP_31]|uniref:helix-turn-helix domain-containing protein n=1 Tax=Halomonas sp. IOP_31 TaxID=2876584 RepID=UPI001E4C07BE|nr:helix-turn-helix transcriptional regulator [Halomonas sp. IOP_31]MCD6009917.1 helix-turn-helix domain-containing protein [Halomonas sp. IOP_31]